MCHEWYVQRWQRPVCGHVEHAWVDERVAASAKGMSVSALCSLYVVSERGEEGQGEIV